MENKKWKEFQKLTEKCYSNMAGIEKDGGCWDKAFGTLKAILADERAVHPEYAKELYLLEDVTDYEYDVSGWLEDYLDEVEMRDENEKLLALCDELLGLFGWQEDSPSDIRFRKVSALNSMGRNDEAMELCRQWLTEEPDNIAAVAASVYANIAVRDLESAEKLLRQHIHEDTQCTEENDILFTAASAFYEIAGNKKEKKRIDQALDEYEKYLEEYFIGGDDGEDESLWGEDALPFY